MKKILAIGEIIWDVYPDKSTIGGAPLNFAAHASQCGAECFLLSAVGIDTLGEEAKKQIKRFRIRDEYVQTNDFPTGQCLVTLDENRVPSYRVADGVAYDHIKVGDRETDALTREKFDAVYFGTLIQRDPDSRTMLHTLMQKLSVPTVFCDINLRKNCYDRKSVSFCLEHATVLKVSNEEEPILRELGFYRVESDDPAEIAKEICRKYPNIKVLILTLGAKGAVAYAAATGELYFQEAIGDTVVSTVGAGDSFSAAWLSEHLSGVPIPLCLKKAAKISGFVVAHQEAVPEYPADF